MAQTYGPKFPCIEDGLVFCLDPKNRKCWSGGADLYTTTQGITTQTGDSSRMDTENFAAGTEFDGSLTQEGYIQFDGSDDFLESALALRYIKDIYGNNIFGDGTTYDGGITWSWWGKGDTGGDPVNRAGLWGSWPGGTWSLGFILRWEESAGDGGPHNFVFSTKGYADAGEFAYGSADYTWDEWHNVVGTWDGTTTKIYVNGVAGTNGTQTAAANTQYTMAIGASNSPNNPFDGKIGPCMLYNRELSAGEVLTNYNRLKGRFGL